MHPLWPDGLDPLIIDEPEGAISDLDNWELLVEEGEEDGSGRFEASLAPDDLHKDNTSGGDPYSVALPDPSADFVLLNARHGLLFVPYLRELISANHLRYLSAAFEENITPPDSDTEFEASLRLIIAGLAKQR